MIRKILPKGGIKTSQKTNKQDIINRVLEEFKQDMEIDCLEPMRELLKTVKIKELKKFLKIY